MQLIPSSEPLLASMPSGREYHTPKMFVIPALEEESIIRMRAPPDAGDGFEGEEEDSADEEEAFGYDVPGGDGVFHRGGPPQGSRF